MIQDAIHYTGLSLPVFPVHSMDGDSCTCKAGENCKNAAKHPRTADGFKSATTDATQVEQWWATWPNANIGIRTGAASGIWVLDVDVDDDGMMTFRQLVDEHGALDAPYSVTGSDGLQYYFAWDAARPVKSRARVLPGIDTRGDGGYVIAPPSLHKTGNRYEWSNGSVPFESGIKPAPEWLVDLVAQDDSAPAASQAPSAPTPSFRKDELEELEDALGYVSSDPRDDWLRVGMALHSTGLGEAAYAVWSRWSATSEKFDPKDQRKTWRSFKSGKDRQVTPASVFGMAYDRGWSGPKRPDFEFYGVTIDREALLANGLAAFDVPVMTADCKDRDTRDAAPDAPSRTEFPDAPQPLTKSLQDLPPFPIDTAFPPSLSWVRELVENVAESIQVSVDMPAMMIPPIATVSAAKKHALRVTADWIENTALWSFVTAESGERKSAVFRVLMEPLVAWERDARAVAREEIARHDSELQLLRMRVKAEREKLIKKGTAPELDGLTCELNELERNEPGMPIVYVSDATGEAIEGLLASNNERLLIAAAESDPLDVAMGRYSRSVPNFGAWLAGHAGDPHKSARRTRDGDDLVAPSLSVLIMVQPRALHHLFANEQAHEKGFVARGFYSLPKSRMGYRSPEVAATDVELHRQWSMTLRRLLDTPIPDAAAEVRLAPDARERFLEFVQDNERMLAPHRRSEALISWYSKLPGGIARLAFSMHVLGIASGTATSDEIPLETIEAALSWSPYLEAHFAAILAEVAEEPAALTARRLLSWIYRHEIAEFSKRDAHQAVKNTALVNSAADIDPALAELVEAGWVLPIAAARQKTGRPAGPRFLVRPDFREHFGQ